MADLPFTLPPWPAEDFSIYGAVEARPTGRVQTLVGRIMHRNWLSIPHVTHHDDADITHLEQRRRAWNQENRGGKCSLLGALVKASVAALERYPQFNVSFSPDGATVYAKKYFHIGIAVDVAGGLLVPVLRNCNTKSMSEITEEIAHISDKARTKGLSMAEMSGGCFTLSSLGHLGGTGFTPIINAPEVAILGICRAQKRFVPDADERPVVRQLLPLSLSYDHRAINGADAARFVRGIAHWLEHHEFS